jgi:hypothetical protein
VKELKLKVTVRGVDPDADLAYLTRNMAKLGIVRADTPPKVQIVHIERADGRLLGLDSEFEEYWHEVQCEGVGDEETQEKCSARAAFAHGVEYAARGRRRVT